MRIIRMLNGLRTAVMLATAAVTVAFAAPPADAAPALSAAERVAQAGQPGEARGSRPGREAKEAARPRRSTQPATVPPRAAPVPAACAAMTGVERRICVECDREPTFKRIGCQQRVFWSACKGKRLFTDDYCRTHQDQGPLRGEGS